MVRINDGNSENVELMPYLIYHNLRRHSHNYRTIRVCTLLLFCVVVCSKRNNSQYRGYLAIEAVPLDDSAFWKKEGTLLLSV